MEYKDDCVHLDRPWMASTPSRTPRRRLKAGRGAAGQIIRREQNYFAGHAARMNYRAVADRDWPIGSGPVESACLQRQGRFKRSGQSGTPLGLRHLCALIETRQNNHWDQLWNQ